MSEKAILVVGGGISGITAALEAAEAGTKVYLVERNYWLGGRVASNSRYFPKMCPPFCGLEINFRRIRTNPNVTVYTGASVESLGGSEGNFTATVKIRPGYINEKCTGCGDCVDACAVDRVDTHNQGMTKTKGIFRPHPMAFPAQFVADPDVCNAGNLTEAASKCKYGAFDVGASEQTVKLDVASVVVATGWKPYNANKLENLGFGKYPNVITNVMMERLISPDGPTAGKLLRPSDNKEISSVAFVQCAGSRDENHLSYCSAVCCMASLKQATCIREMLPEAQVSVFYIDIRAPGRYEDFYRKLKDEGKVNLVKGKVAKVTGSSSSGNLLVEAEDVAGGTKSTKEVDLVVLATGMVPDASELPFKVNKDNYGFLVGTDQVRGIYPAGCVKRPVAVAASVRDATGAALLAMAEGVR